MTRPSVRPATRSRRSPGGPQAPTVCPTAQPPLVLYGRRRRFNEMKKGVSFPMRQCGFRNIVFFSSLMANEGLGAGQLFHRNEDRRVGACFRFRGAVFHFTPHLFVIRLLMCRAWCWGTGGIFYQHTETGNTPKAPRARRYDAAYRQRNRQAWKLQLNLSWTFTAQDHGSTHLCSISSLTPNPRPYIYTAEPFIIYCTTRPTP